MHTHDATNEFDAIVVGGSYAGLSAAMQLARARRRVVVIDAGQRRNRYARHSHGFLTQDGIEGSTIAALGQAQLLTYPTVTWIEGTAVNAVAHNGGFRVTKHDGQTLRGHRLVLATGVIDELPLIDGLTERWGRHVFTCPYCDGYELEQGNIGVLATSALSMHQALMLPDWGDVTLFLNGAFEPDETQLIALDERNVTIERALVRRVTGKADVEMRDGRTQSMDGLFVIGRTRIGSPIAEKLGCAIEQGPMGPYIRTDQKKASTVAGVYCCGDAASMFPGVPHAVADGAMAGAAAHQSLVFGTVATQTLKNE
ncbi:NAD(P)/FAD-dependent oxidoreductase [Allopusillimonas ginsengisoli]|uniref:NAD(P)/FAD-dependent oxidoreductase n=1 Tax=Allopusillimonas ginsengisoli TaxID=453575 RepID=UPI001021564A|nr:NAD(P)/FAD-dependent oxidoreductase [Allopusillimonas ginsengisoli]TEA69455.1 NAD(P)/FAD-dependent oxidoreductase [Allopusillimonas ginsengisoli]